MDFGQDVRAISSGLRCIEDTKTSSKGTREGVILPHLILEAATHAMVTFRFVTKATHPQRGEKRETAEESVPLDWPITP